MDDLILQAAIWQDEHWLDGSAMLKDSRITSDMAGAIRVVLLSLNHNLRLKAQLTQLPAARLVVGQGIIPTANTTSLGHISSI